MSEKSTTREVTSLLKPYLLLAPPAPSNDAAADEKLRADTNALADEPLLSNLKVSCRGLILLKLNPRSINDEDDQSLATAKLAQQAVLKIYENAAAPATASGTVHQPPKFIQRLVPILSTCALEEESLKACAARVAGIAALEFQHFNNSIEDKDGQPTLPLPPTFGIHINNRESGTGNAAASSTREGTSTTATGAAPAPAAAPVALNRMQIINSVAAGLMVELKTKYNIEATVNLTAPTVVVVVEVMPIMGKAYAGIAILPQRVCTLKPKLGIKALRQGNSVADTGGGGKGKGGKKEIQKREQAM